MITGVRRNSLTAALGVVMVPFTVAGLDADAISVDRERSTFTLQSAPSILRLDRERSTLPVATVTSDLKQSIVILKADLLFDFGEAILTAPAQHKIAELARDLPDGASVTISGHTDSVGTSESNYVLSVARADAVAAVLGAARPDLTVTTVGYGETRPRAENTVEGVDNPLGRAENRRVEVEYANSGG